MHGGEQCRREDCGIDLMACGDWRDLRITLLGNTDTFVYSYDSSSTSAEKTNRPHEIPSEADSDIFNNCPARYVLLGKNLFGHVGHNSSF